MYIIQHQLYHISGMYIVCAVHVHYIIYIYMRYIYSIYIYYMWLVTVQPMRYNIIAINNVGTDTHKKHKHRKLGASG